jgi:hypothetical protein
MSGQKIIDGLQEAIERVKAMTPEERAEMYRAQRRSFMRAEAFFGSDADERAYTRAVAHGDEAEIARLEAEASARVDAVDAYLDPIEPSTSEY